MYDDRTGAPRRARRRRIAATSLWLLLAGIGGSAACAAADRAPEAADAPAAMAGQYPQAPGGMMPPGLMPPPQPGRQHHLEVAMAEDALRLLEQGGQAGGYAPVRTFPVPDYSQPYDGPRSDFRETVYWAPSVRTNESGKAEVTFYLSDAVTSFRATAQGIAKGGHPTIGDALVASKLPVSLAAKLPLEVSRGDVVDLPVLLTNGTKRNQRATVTPTFGAAFRAKQRGATGEVQLAPGQSRTEYYTLEVVGDGTAPEAGELAVSVEASHLRDSIARTVRVVPLGFPGEESAAGTLSKRQKLSVRLPDAVEGSVRATLSFYPSPTTQMVAGTEAMIAEPSGCFEQASSTNYPNVMVLSYLRANEAAAKDIEADVRGKLDRGYDMLVGYETDAKGFEWFGAAPGHEALSAYGIMQFADMAKVYGEVDGEMLKRTTAWLKGRRNGKGGYQRNPQALDSFGRASDDVTDAYITFALTEAGERDLSAELARSRRLAETTSDPYVLALAAGALANVEPKSEGTGKALDRLVAMQSKEGHFPGSAGSITMSGGQALDIETTSLATLALLAAPVGRYDAAVKRGLAWIQKQNTGGAFASTQATVLALKALAAGAGASRVLPEGTISVIVNGKEPHRIPVGPKVTNTIALDGLARELRTGDNEIQIEASADMQKLPFSLVVEYRTERPPSSTDAKVHVSTKAHAAKIKNGEALTVKTSIENITAKGLPMVVARIGIPGGLTFQTKELDDLVKRKVIDYYETREREVIAYLRAMAPNQSRQFDLHFLAQVPGTFTAPASSAYLYYTDEDKHYAEPIVVAVSR